MAKKFRIIIEGTCDTRRTAKKILDACSDSISKITKDNVNLTLEDPTRTISVSWSLEDVMGRAEDRGTKITIARARKILAEMERKHDASVGISWDVIDCYLDDESIR